MAGETVPRRGRPGLRRKCVPAWHAPRKVPRPCVLVPRAGGRGVRASMPPCTRIGTEQAPPPSLLAVRPRLIEWVLGVGDGARVGRSCPAGARGPTCAGGLALPFPRTKHLPAKDL